MSCRQEAPRRRSVARTFLAACMPLSGATGNWCPWNGWLWWSGATPDSSLKSASEWAWPARPRLPRTRQRRSYLTVIRRNWHLLPYDQLLVLLGWSAEELAYALREDDFLFIKLGSLKPHCEPLIMQAQARTHRRASKIAAWSARSLGRVEPPRCLPIPFQLCRRPGSRPAPRRRARKRPLFSPRFCYSYFALYGDPLLDRRDPIRMVPGAAGALGHRRRLAAGRAVQAGAFSWQPDSAARLERAPGGTPRAVARARKHGIGIYLYLNEPRAMPLTFFRSIPS